MSVDEAGKGQGVAFSSAGGVLVLEDQQGRFQTATEPPIEQPWVAGDLSVVSQRGPLTPP